MNERTAVEDRIIFLEHRIRRLQFAGVLGVLGFVIVGYCAFHSSSVRADDSGQILRVRGLVVEDAQGRPRILLGAPVPKVPGRKRQDDNIGIILVGENGADRVAIGDPTPAPQAGGKVVQRIAPGTGLVVDDVQGNERGGIGVLDNGRGAVCMDYPDPINRDAVCIGVIPGAFAGLIVNAPSGDEGERAMMAVMNDGTSIMKLADTDANERAMVLVQGNSPAQFLVLDPKTHSKVNVLADIKTK
jgi:hypothetical protein